MGLDLAKSTFLARWPAYLKTVALGRRVHLWTPFLLATLCGTAELALLLAAAWGLFELALLGLLSIPSGSGGPALSYLALFPPAGRRVIQAVITLAATAVGLWQQPTKLWAWSLGSVPVGLLLTLLANGLWQGSWVDLLEESDAFRLLLVFWAVPAVPVVVLGTLIHFGPLLFYWSAVRPWRGSDPATRSLLRLAWEECRFGPALKTTFKWASIAGVFVVLIVWGEEILSGLDGAYSRVTGKPREGESRGATLFYGVLFAGYLIYQTARGKIRWASLFRVRRASFARWGEILREIGAWIRVSFGTVGGLKKTMGGLKRLLRSASLALLKFGGCFVLAILLMTVLVIFSTVSGRMALLLGVLLILVLLGRELAAWANAHRGSWEPAAWTRELKTAQPRRQAMLLRRTTHQSLSLHPEAFLRLLLDLESSIHKEPALSTYWDRRDQLEQALRQER